MAVQHEFNVQQVALCTFQRGVKEFPASMVCHKLWDCTRVHTSDVSSRESSILREPWLKLRWLGVAIVRHAHRSIHQAAQLVPVLSSKFMQQKRAEFDSIASKNQRSDAAPRSPNSDKATHANPLSMSVVSNTPRIGIGMTHMAH